MHDFELRIGLEPTLEFDVLMRARAVYLSAICIIVVQIFQQLTLLWAYRIWNINNTALLLATSLMFLTVFGLRYYRNFTFYSLSLIHI